MSDKNKTPQEETEIESTGVVESQWQPSVENAGGIVLEPDQYIIDPDFAGLLGIDAFEDLIKVKR